MIRVKGLANALLSAVMGELPALSALPEVQYPCTHIHMARVVYVDGVSFVFFDDCHRDIPADELVTKANRLYVLAMAPKCGRCGRRLAEHVKGVCQTTLTPGLTQKHVYDPMLPKCVIFRSERNIAPECVA